MYIMGRNVLLPCENADQFIKNCKSALGAHVSTKANSLSRHIKAVFTINYPEWGGLSYSNLSCYSFVINPKKC